VRTFTDDEMNELLPAAKAYSVVLLKQGPNFTDDTAPAVIWEHGRRNFGLRHDGVLPIVLPASQVARLFDEVAGFVGYQLTIDLPRQVIVKPDGGELPFDVQPFRKYCLVNGFDDIGLTLRPADKIRAFEAERLARMPWLAQRPR